MWKGWTHNGKAPVFKSGGEMANTYDLFPPVNVKWQSERYVGDEIY